MRGRTAHGVRQRGAARARLHREEPALSQLQVSANAWPGGESCLFVVDDSLFFWSSHLFWGQSFLHLSVKCLDAPAGVTREEGHTGVMALFLRARISEEDMNAVDTSRCTKVSHTRPHKKHFKISRAAFIPSTFESVAFDRLSLALFCSPNPRFLALFVPDSLAGSLLRHRGDARSA